MAATNEKQKLAEITEANFEDQVLKAATPFLLDFSAEWCAPCKAIHPVIKDLAAEYAGKVSFGQLDIEKSSKIAAKYQVASIPTLLLFHHGKVLGQLTGAHPKARIVELIKKAL